MVLCGFGFFVGSGGAFALDAPQLFDEMLVRTDRLQPSTLIFVMHFAKVKCYQEMWFPVSGIEWKQQLDEM